MAATSIRIETDFQRLVVERALALARELEKASMEAPDGQVLHRFEGLLLTQGREFLNTTLEQITQHTADEAVKKGDSRGPARAASDSVTKAPRRARS